MVEGRLLSVSRKSVTRISGKLQKDKIRSEELSY